MVFKIWSSNVITVALIWRKTWTTVRTNCLHPGWTSSWSSPNLALQFNGLGPCTRPHAYSSMPAQLLPVQPKYPSFFFFFFLVISGFRNLVVHGYTRTVEHHPNHPKVCLTVRIKQTLSRKSLFLIRSLFPGRVCFQFELSIVEMDGWRDALQPCRVARLQDFRIRLFQYTQPYPPIPATRQQITLTLI